MTLPIILTVLTASPGTEGDDMMYLGICIVCLHDEGVASTVTRYNVVTQEKFCNTKMSIMNETE